MNGIVECSRCQLILSISVMCFPLSQCQSLSSLLHSIVAYLIQFNRTAKISPRANLVCIWIWIHEYSLQS
ncbi:hypothetical protein Lalb_Chr01g0000681 [Lupinus albus]|uniref:Uncharacterized protein n=1 Tax=Lupinus albus TaxID=3870 RepID=A0A6A4QZI5_LUPAL|nr:hypothetical protein Lalb_Chr01g0000681 [Lupinus albus]